MSRTVEDQTHTVADRTHTFTHTTHTRMDLASSTETSEDEGGADKHFVTVRGGSGGRGRHSLNVLASGGPATAACFPPPGEQKTGRKGHKQVRCVLLSNQIGAAANTAHVCARVIRVRGT
jgi:hypothetical protein